MQKPDYKPDKEKATQQKEQQMNLAGDRLTEEKHLEECIKVIQSNIESYLQEYRVISAETKEMYDNYRSDNPELHNELSVGLDIKSMLERILNRNMMAIKKPYFGRIDYRETDSGDSFCLYIGKHGIRKNITENMIIDWRTPVASVYYDSDIGLSSYKTPTGEKINIDLKLKRTYEIEDGKLIDFYDSEVVTNDEFLTRYLSKNKEVVLGEIIATIQKEQNEIIRDEPWHSVIVQGVAGSGKTTVAMHRISYILYNYKDKFRPDEFFIIGSNRMLLNYITGVLPNLDVYNVNNMTMEEFFLLILDKDFDLKKSKCSLDNKYYKWLKATDSDLISSMQHFKGSLTFINALMLYMEEFEIDSVIKDDIEYNGRVIYSGEEIMYLLKFFKDLPLQEKINMLNSRLAYKIRSINEEMDKRKEEVSAEVNRFKNYFGIRNKKFDLMEVYKKFLSDLIQERDAYISKNIKLPGRKALELLIDRLSRRELDLYDLAALTYIKKRLKKTKDFDYVSHVVIDEAQDFGAAVFKVFKLAFPSCTFTIMGDVTQNINYCSGMNDWEDIRQQVFDPARDKFYVLAKSYRNTVEISNYASRILKKCSFKTYDIQPVIRHGKEVAVKRLADEKAMLKELAGIIKDSRDRGFDTIAVICRNADETIRVRKLLKPYIGLENSEGSISAGQAEISQKTRPEQNQDGKMADIKAKTASGKTKAASGKNKDSGSSDSELIEEEFENVVFTKGVMVLPIYMTKGLEFDTVILWNPDDESYTVNDADAKLIYVAVTRALHELHILYKGKLSGLLE